MKFSIKIADENHSWWEEYDDYRVNDNRDAFAYGKVLCEYWNSDLRQHEKPRKILNAQITGPGKKPPKNYDPRQMEMGFIHAPKRAQ